MQFLLVTSSPEFSVLAILQSQDGYYTTMFSEREGKCYRPTPKPIPGEGMESS